MLGVDPDHSTRSDAHRDCASRISAGLSAEGIWIPFTAHDAYYPPVVYRFVITRGLRATCFNRRMCLRSPLDNRFLMICLLFSTIYVNSLSSTPECEAYAFVDDRASLIATFSVSVPG